MITTYWSFLVIVTCLFSCSDSSKVFKGVITALVHGSTKEQFHLLCRRNKSILQWLWFTDENLKKYNPDIVLFHEAGLSDENKTYIQSETPELPLIFREIKFDGHAQYNEPGDYDTGYKMVNPECTRNRWTNHFSHGYKNMCRFWFMGVLEYVTEWDWMLRLDDDCEFEEDARYMLPDPFIHSKETKPVFFSSPSWLPLNRQGFDFIGKDGDGDVVKGLGNFVRRFAAKHNITDRIDSWHAPYTNVMFVNLRWFKHHQHYKHFYEDAPSDAVDGSLIDHSAVAGKYHPRNITAQGLMLREFMNAVDESNCIYTSRWGDMPLWGAALAIINEPVRFINISYYHWSHKIVVWSKSTSGTTPRQDIPWMDVWADSNHVNAGFRSTRIIMD